MAQRRWVPFALVGLLGVFQLAAETLQLDYIGGTVEVRRGAAWSEAKAGDRFAPEDTLRVAPDTVVELSSRELRIVMARPGIFSLSDVIGETRRVGSWGVGELLGAKLRSLFGPARQEQGVSQGGVRAGTEKGAEIWADADREALESVRKALADTDYPRALSLLEAAIVGAAGPSADEMRFDLGWLLALRGDKARALAVLLPVEADPTQPYYPALVMLKGQLLLESLDYPAALRLCDAYLAQDGRGPFAQEIGYVSAMAARGMDDAAGTARRLRQAASLDPTSDVGRAAAEQARGL